MSKRLSELRKKPHWSFSSLNGFLNICALQWAFKYFYKLEAESTPISLVFGSAFHKTAEWISRGRMKNNYASSEDVMELFSESWRRECENRENLFLPSDQWEELNATGQKMVACLNREWTEDEILAVSEAFSVELPGVSKPLIGEIDLVVKDEFGDVTLVDWKTAARKWPDKKSDKDMQATCFSYAWKRLTGLIPNFRYDVVTKTKDPSYNQHETIRTEDDFARLIHLARSVEKAVEAEVFLPNETSFFCGGCEYASACKEWHRESDVIISLPLAA